MKASKLDARILLRAAEIVEQGWCQRDEARDASGREAESTDPTATAWSAYGALILAAGQIAPGLPEVWGRALIRTCQVTGVLSLVDWNYAAERTADEVGTMLRRAAERA